MASREEKIAQAREYVEVNEDDFYALIIFDVSVALHPDKDPMEIANVVLNTYHRNAI